MDEYSGAKLHPARLLEDVNPESDSLVTGLAVILGLLCIGLSIWLLARAAMFLYIITRWHS